MRTNAPRLVTVAAALVLTVVGLHLTILPIQFVSDLLNQTGLSLQRNPHGYLALLASPVLLIIGSLFPGV